MAHLTADKLDELNTFLATNNYVNGDLPGADDNRVFEALKGLPSKESHPEVYFWYLIIQAFTPQVRAQWTAAAKKPEQQQQKAPAPAKVEDDDDLFGDDDPEAEAAAKKLAEEKKAQAQKKKKKEVIAKTIVVFEVKVYEAEKVELLESIAAKIRAEITPEGLVWGQEHKIIEVAFGAKKLSMSMVIEDAKIQTDDVFDKILSWEDDVQSVDVTSMQKV